MIRALAAIAMCGCGRLGFDTGESPPAVGELVVQSGTTALLDGQMIAQVAIDAVDKNHTMVVFSLAVTDFEPDDIKVTGRLAAPNLVAFEREGTEFEVLISYSVVTWDRMTVRHGSATMMNAIGTTVSIDPPVDVARSFPLVTSRNGGSEFDDDELMSAEILDADRLSFELGDPNTDSVAIEWQVVEIPDANVRSGRISIVPGTTTQDITFAEVDLDRTWLVFSYITTDDPPLQGRHRTVNGKLSDSTTATFERGGTVGTVTITYYVIELARGRVKTGEENFPTSETTSHATLENFDLARAFPFAGGIAGVGGSTDSAMDGPAPAWPALTLSTPNDLDLVRGVADGTARTNYSVVELELP